MTRGLVFVGLIAALSTGRIAAAQYVAVDLGTLGGTTSHAAAVNDKGQVVGDSTLAGDVTTHAFFWTTTSGMVDLGTLGGATSRAVALNDSGQVVGSSSTADGSTHAFSWTATSGMVDLGTGTFGGPNSSAFAVNDNGQVVGFSTTPAIDPNGAHVERAFSWTSDGGMIDVGIAGDSHGIAHAVNNRGQVVGESGPFAPFLRHAFLWTPPGEIIDIGAIPRLGSAALDVNDAGEVIGTLYGDLTPGSFFWSSATGILPVGTGSGTRSAVAINNLGQVVGSSFTMGSSLHHAFTWTPMGGIVDLGTLGGDQSAAVAVNDSGQVVGYSNTADGLIHAFFWTAGAGMIDLGTLGGSNSYANDVNDNGQIVGQSEVTVTHATHATLWTVPLPVDVLSLFHALRAQVESYELHHGIENALIAKLDAALAIWSRGDTTAAANQLGAFIHQVDAQRGKKLSEPEANALIAAAEEILRALR